MTITNGTTALTTTRGYTFTDPQGNIWPNPQPEWLVLKHGWWVVVPEPYVPTQEEIIANLSNTVQIHLDSVMHVRYYDGILSACSYATSKSKRFGPEGIAAVLWRDAVWEYLYVVLADCLAGRRTIPTADELLLELPQMVWPDGMVAVFADGVLTEQENAMFTGTLWTSIKSFFGF